MTGRALWGDRVGQLGRTTRPGVWTPTHRCVLAGGRGDSDELGQCARPDLLAYAVDDHRSLRPMSPPRAVIRSMELRVAGVQRVVGAATRGGGCTGFSARPRISTQRLRPRVRCAGPGVCTNRAPSWAPVGDYSRATIVASIEGVRASVKPQICSDQGVFVSEAASEHLAPPLHQERRVARTRGVPDVGREPVTPWARTRHGNPYRVAPRADGHAERAGGGWHRANDLSAGSRRARGKPDALFVDRPAHGISDAFNLQL